MAPKRGKNKKYSGITALPGGTELEALAWGYHTAKGVRGDRIAGLVNNATEELLSGTGQAQWGVHIPDLGIQLPASRQTVIESVGEAQLAAAFAGSARRKHVYDPLSTYNQDQALKALSGASGSRSAYSTGSSTFPDGSILTNAKSFKGQTREAKAKRAARARDKADKDPLRTPLTLKDVVTSDEKLFQAEQRARPGATSSLRGRPGATSSLRERPNTPHPEARRVSIPRAVKVPRPADWSPRPTKMPTLREGTTIPPLSEGTTMPPLSAEDLYEIMGL